MALLMTTDADEEDEEEEAKPKLEESTQSQRFGGERTATMEEDDGNLSKQKFVHDSTESSSLAK